MAVELLDELVRLGIVPKAVTASELATTYLARDHANRYVIVKDAVPPYMAFSDTYSAASSWRKPDGTLVSKDPAIAGSVSVSPNPLRMSAGSTKQLTALVSPADAAQYVTWSSDNPNVPITADGKVTLPQVLDVATQATFTATTANGKTGSTSLEVVSATGILRYVSALNRHPNFALELKQSTEMAMITRAPHRIGSGNVSGIRMIVPNSYIWLGGPESTGNTLTVDDIFVEIAGIGSRRITFSGANGIIVEPGKYGWSNVTLLPSAFGLDSFPWGSEFWVRSQIRIPANGKFPTVETWDVSGVSCWTFNPAANACTNIGGTGEFTFTNTSRAGAYQIWTPIVCGYFEKGDPEVGIDFGDSIGAGSGDAGSDNRGRGYLARSRIGTDWAQCIAGLNMTRPAGQAFFWSTRPDLILLSQLANEIANLHGTNNFDGTANMIDSSVAYVANLSIDVYKTCVENQITAVGARPFTVIHCPLLTRTKAPTGNTPADQESYGVKWEAGGNVDLYNQIMAADPRVNLYFEHAALVRASTVKGEALYYRSKEGAKMFPDGTHPAEYLAVQLAASLRTQRLALAVARAA